MDTSNDTGKLRAAIALMELRHLEEIRRVEEEFDLIFDGLQSTKTKKAVKHKSIPMSNNQAADTYSNSFAHTATNSMRIIDSNDLGSQFKKLFGKSFQFNGQNRFRSKPNGLKSRVIAGLEGILKWLKS